MSTILAFAGSLRSESFNKRLVRIAAEGARESGSQVDVIDLADFRLYMFRGEESILDRLDNVAGFTQGRRARINHQCSG